MTHDIPHSEDVEQSQLATLYQSLKYTLLFFIQF